ncbi:hypothetical protein HBH56_026790 [Parastagonospora nodorum]|uniref:Uncharacterized protein n=1 Tax=Phaeosphaeria nodorum (strain SN15 / ATCC MYA-4574 / FGSC 10173) TaxID=321614 RepID=A0A7U2I237_PHANO|nr:hypothetical protein HBH56_026790 [Parastagonospora nodorum]QRC98983.1 hypothetical protein JI435_304550 [Parastagonospora nodorum SN15]KAH3934144.1 hypothetical protein HBH54_055250 [Parastagonospora nodorum]KAH4054929.1 hypothetical protein HBH49_069190 [Parastagonospora nodorum]KAH4141803.1 hypothetical protein HBH45_061530 [Parastagonospora nodorum]
MESQATPVQTSIGALSTAFLANVKLTFGESQEATTIFGALCEFRQGRASKRETISTISEALGNHHDLKRDLQNILDHQDARWGAGDFDNLPLALVEGQPPQFLQPVHEPQMRHPFLSSPWDSNNGLLTTFSPMGLTGLSQYSTFAKSTEQPALMPQNGPDSSHPPSRAMLSSPFVPDLVGPSRAQPTYPGIDQTSGFLPYPRPKQIFGTNPSQPEQSNIPQESPYLEPWWSEDWFTQTGHQQGRGEIMSTQESSEVTSAQKPLTAPPAASFLGSSKLNWTPMPMDAPDIGMPPPSRKRSRALSFLQPKAEGGQASGNTVHDYNVSKSQTASPPSTKVSRDSTSVAPKGSGQFIHSVCGRGFTRRQAVKKHHWGDKLDDLDTTTGCWAKHKKPNVNWNEHPSCKVISRVPALHSYGVGSTSAASNAPAVPAMVPSYRDTIPGPSTFLQYHSHGLPGTATPSSSSPFQDLLTAVNIAASIEEPTLKGRIDSLIGSNLDVQADAAAQGQFRPTSSFTNQHPGNNVGNNVEQYHGYWPSLGYNFGVGSSSPVPEPTGMRFSSQPNFIDPTTPFMPPMASDPVYRHQHNSTQLDEEFVTDPGFFLDSGLDQNSGSEQDSGLDRNSGLDQLSQPSASG